MLGISPEVELLRPANVCLPLDKGARGDNSEVVFIHWKLDEKGRKVGCVMETRPANEDENCFSTTVRGSTSSGYVNSSLSRSYLK